MTKSVRPFDEVDTSRTPLDMEHPEESRSHAPDLAAHIRDDRHRPRFSQTPPSSLPLQLHGHANLFLHFLRRSIAGEDARLLFSRGVVTPATVGALWPGPQPRPIRKNSPQTRILMISEGTLSHIRHLEAPLNEICLRLCSCSGGLDVCQTSRRDIPCDPYGSSVKGSFWNRSVNRCSGFITQFEL